jgi:hypothetical protein
MLIFVALVAFFFPCAHVYRNWLARSYGQTYIEAVLHSDLHEGDSLEQVASHFDSIRLLTPSTDTDYLSNLATICAQKGFAVHPNDEFYHVSVESGPGAYLQFRNRRLVNLWNTAFIDENKYPSQRASNSAPLLFFTIYASVSTLVLASDSLLQCCMRQNKRLNVSGGPRPN